LREKLANGIKEKGLGGFIKMPGVLPHEKLIDLYKNGEIDCVVLPSINTPSGEHEGIPVAIMEAMVYEVPVISTNTGAIPELLGGGAGIMVKEKSGAELANAIKNAMFDKSKTEKMANIAREKIENDFNIQKTTRALLELIKIS
jgi:glycosyltransferase involved in cell wall biosynthesis